MYINREQSILKFFPGIKRFRFDQINKAFFDGTRSSWNDVTTLPKTMKSTLDKQISWLSFENKKVYVSKKQDTYKGIFKTQDGQFFESVLMANRKGQWTICVSSQIGCAMRCTFCATGTMGLKRNLHSDEIIDQYRFWQQFLVERPKLPQRISNIVFMGMGEPLANYDNVKNSINTLLKYTDLGPTKIMLSTVGILPQMQKLLTDPDWPKVRIAISLHSANQEKRKEIVPTTVPDFLKKLAVWSHEYQRLLGNRNHKLTFEYTLISHVNDTPELAQKLAKYIVKTAVSKINVIPYNPVKGKIFNRAEQERVDAFKNILRDHNINVTERTTMGADIDAACGQLAIDATI
ncbi:MAG: 23S rRNA (adenine(2503)-C(2))-methyltransferase RlmN [Candidatus Magasanikbacteria bacterium]|jgi:23S rRNA (adenine2503-C2)-methyltransferase|nr:23S rRNA (adenine(2503)-C(2))-methyltransferase RlmN [Candidatus Magasanikbacteria bacterium]MBT4221293.1 23S rRNA (adenine(2503)-C(2))-methyltransferase RlmN [Candidatus Magasanikbacteria bacterium]MBT4350439.1 23S rRNA (adenine(2503)-C(2))-methyltransferase RlmN [Candidatus Magasanikbacteria bacterium]MBT4542014.1 23S rRNA (adenine(2503)-C(2))-methyltransferase RlmN [Candidatus Magasanikbacteria bacterium]MBT6253417.1 23S rRNA (adenine(2503)-C(2))-methyltransferase RlmN [Candidatus Magasan